MAKMTLQDIADHLELSRVTVSKVINGQPGVASKTRQRVLDALVEFRYKNYAEFTYPTTTNTKQKRFAIFSIAPDFSEFWLTIIRSISNCLEALNHQATYFFVGGSMVEHRLPDGLTRENLDGVIVLNVYDNLLINQVAALGIPTVYLDLPVNRNRDALPGDTIFLDGTNVFHAFTQAFLRQGIRQLGFVGDIAYAQTIADRWSGFRQGLERFGLQANPRYCHTGSVPGRYYVAEEIATLFTQRYDFPEAILCANDAIGYLVAERAESMGLRIGEDLLLTGFDGTPVPTNATPLTSAYIDTNTLGERLVTQLMLNLTMKDKTKELIFLEPEISLTASVGADFQL